MLAWKRDDETFIEFYQRLLLLLGQEKELFVRASTIDTHNGLKTFNLERQLRRIDQNIVEIRHRIAEEEAFYSNMSFENLLCENFELEELPSEEDDDDPENDNGTDEVEQETEPSVQSRQEMQQETNDQQDGTQHNPFFDESAISINNSRDSQAWQVIWDQK